MRQFIVLLALATVASAAFKADVKVKWGASLFGSGKDFIIDMPTFEEDAINLNWVQAERNANSHLPTLKLFCHPVDVSICFLYDQNKRFAGYQINVAVGKLADTPIDPETLGFTVWTYAGIDYWSNELFLIDEDKAEAVSDDVTLRRNSIWVRGFNPNELVEVPTNPKDIVAKTLYTKQGCIPFMGSHHYYNMTTSTPCNEIFPWFTLYDDDQLIGMGLLIFGKYAAHTGNYVEKFERPPSAAVRLIVPSAPKCLYRMAEDPGVLTMHVYFVSNPNSAGLNLGCSTINLG